MGNNNNEPDAERTRLKTPGKTQPSANAKDDKTVVNVSQDEATRVKTKSSKLAETVLAKRPADAETVLAKKSNSDETIATGGLDAELSDSAITKVDRLERTPRPRLGQAHRSIDVGSIIRERFVLKEVLGKGGMGAVYLALDLIKKEAGDNNPYIAIKLLSGDFRDHPHAFVTLQREAKKTQELAHPNIVTVYDFDREDDVVYLTMEQLSGAPLIDVIKGKTDKVLNFKDSLDIIIQIARGLAYAHSKGIVHSDLKPANLFLTEDNTIKILDFGIARAANQELYQDNFDVGQLGAMTLSYASPEMIRMESPHPSDDIYALGIIACELLGGFHPFDRTDAKTAIEKHLHPKIPEVKNPFIRKCIRQALSLEREHRIADANIFVKKFSNAVSAPKRFVGGAAAIALAAVANYFYIQSIEVEAIPFESLPAEQQAQFQSYLDEGYTALKFQDLQEAVVKFNSAFEIHGTNKKIEKAKKEVVAIFKENMEGAPDEKTRVFFQEQMTELKRYPAFADLEGL